MNFTCEIKEDDCEEKKNQKILEICQENSDCEFCSEQELEEPAHDESLVVDPEIVPTLNPQTEVTPEIIEADLSAITEESPKKDVIEKLIERNIVIENDNEKKYYRGYVEPSSNITTIIRLTNLINNTNIVNVPTTLNNTNINNIHIVNNKSVTESGGKYGLGTVEAGPCCWLMKPGSCKKTTMGLKCSHKKTKVCGKQCVKEMIYPSQNPCGNIPQWPYVICNNMPYYPTYEDVNEDDDQMSLFPEDDELENPDSGWIIMQEKCKIVSEDGLHITNCTDNDLEFDHPFARNSIDDSHKRNPRFAVHNQQNQMQHPIMQPMYVPVIPVYIPQYFLPQPMMASYPQQLPLPPMENSQYFEEPIIESKASNPYRKSKKHAKKHQIVFEHDDEL